MNRKPRNTSACAPITPAYPQTTISGLMTRSELVSLVADLRGQIATLTQQLTNVRRRHDSCESALAKYNGFLENTIADQRAAFETLGKALTPSVRVK